jgi:kinesin family protein 4/21/27
MSDKTIPVRVAVRCRPLVESEIRDGCQSALQFPAGSQVIAGSDKVFSYDYVFQPSSSQSSVHDLAVNPLLDNLFKGTQKNLCLKANDFNIAN